MRAVTELSTQVEHAAACRAFGVGRSSFYRRRKPREQKQPAAGRRRSRRRLTDEERRKLLEALNSERFADCSPPQIYATLLDEGVYLCSISTMYRILRAEQQVRERRDQLQRPNYAKPELLATGPNQVWSWDITRLPGPAKWVYFQLYVILDIFSRYVVGWLVAERESESLAVELIEQTCAKQNIRPGELTIHADRGSSMTSKSVAFLLADLGVEKTHSRPHVSNDNPYSESQFKTMKYRPEFPRRFGALAEARAFGGVFFPWYNTEHRHSGIGLLTPEAVHYGRGQVIVQNRASVLEQAYVANPERFVRGIPRPPALPIAAWINPPEDQASMFGQAVAGRGLVPSTMQLVRAEDRATQGCDLSAVADANTEDGNPVGSRSLLRVGHQAINPRGSGGQRSRAAANELIGSLVAN
jgi:putative transposase